MKLNLYQRKVDFDVFGSFTNFSFQHFQKYQTNQAKQLQLQWNFNSPESVKCHLFFLNFVNFCQGKIVFMIKNKLNGITAFWNLVIEFLYIAFSSSQTRDLFSFTLIQQITYNVRRNTKLHLQKISSLVLSTRALLVRMCSLVAVQLRLWPWWPGFGWYIITDSV